jgi:hypothetical protein
VLHRTIIKKWNGLEEGKGRITYVEYIRFAGL